MHLESSILIGRKPEDVWRFLGSVANIATWDRGVERTRANHSATEYAVGLEFDTFAKGDESDWGKMSYKVAEIGSDHCKVHLTSSTGNARYFKQATWTFRSRPHPDGTTLVCSVDFVTRLRYFFLAPLLYLKRSALAIDLESLKRAIENEGLQKS
jgi:hypothetical protein